jgi:queuine tRNA-ribosyltransferase
MDPKTKQSRLGFQLLRGDRGGPRRGLYETFHGNFQTPCFAPVGTLASVKGLLPTQVRETGAELILANTYHLALRPGEEIIKAAGGLHRFMDWNGPILTDSGGFQVFSLEGLRRVDDSGVYFAGSQSGKALFLDPQETLRIQRDLGSDIAMVLDECPPAGAPRSQVKDATRRTLLWAQQASQTHQEWGGASRGQALFGIVQGGLYSDLRRECAEQLSQLPFDGFAIGGVSVGEPKPEMYRVVEETSPFLPENQIRYLMGIGDPDDLFQAVLRGIDMFDCVSPTRHGRNNLLYVPEGRLKIRNSAFKNDFRPVQENCPCPACQRFSRAYLRHLALAKEILGAILQSLHNITFLEVLMQNLRILILEGRTPQELKEWFCETYPGWNKPK